MDKSNLFKPAGYSKTTPAEGKSVAIFNNLINHDFIKPYTTVSDKTPNIDGPQLWRKYAALLCADGYLCLAIRKGIFIYESQV